MKKVKKKKSQKKPATAKQTMLSLLLLMRPHQWIKSLFVFTGLIFGHAWTDTDLVYAVVTAAVAFTLLASSVYIVNDIVDVDDDREHPQKRHRPIAAGNVSLRLAIAWATILFIAALCLGYLAGTRVLMFLLFYVLINVAYNAGLKQVAVLDVLLISAGFMLRILAGTEGVGIPPSHWLLLCGLMVTLFLGFTKRRAELLVVNQAGRQGRKVLQKYDAGVLDVFIAISATSAIIAYSLYTVSPETVRIHGTTNLIYTVPFVVYGIFRYIYSLHRHQQGEDTARELLADPQFLLTVLAWGLTVLYLIA